MTIEDAVTTVAERPRQVAGSEIVALHAADGRIAAVDVHAGNDLPRFVNSAVDG